MTSQNTHPKDCFTCEIYQEVLEEYQDHLTKENKDEILDALKK